MTTDLGAAQWRYAICTDAGLLLYSGLTAARPARAARRAAHSRAIIELQVPARVLTDLATGRDLGADPTALQAWIPVIADLARRAADPTAAGPPPDPGRRFPGTALRREIQIRTATCVFPGCRAPAARGDLDHRIEHARGGPSTQDNLDPRCRHDHRLRHEGGWTVLRTSTSHLWTSRLARTNTVPIKPILDQLPDPRPSPIEKAWGPSGSGSEPAEEAWAESDSWHPGPPPLAQPPPEPEPDPPPPGPPLDEPAF